MRPVGEIVLRQNHQIFANDSPRASLRKRDDWKQGCQIDTNQMSKIGFFQF